MLLKKRESDHFTQQQSHNSHRLLHHHVARSRSRTATMRAAAKPVERLELRHLVGRPRQLHRLQLRYRLVHALVQPHRGRHRCMAHARHHKQVHVHEHLLDQHIGLQRTPTGGRHSGHRSVREAGGVRRAWVADREAQVVAHQEHRGRRKHGGCADHGHLYTLRLAPLDPCMNKKKLAHSSRQPQNSLLARLAAP
ncbi:hypothetical protein BC828DRAFT_2345 [Blastocladiella britannica]|nr:hypothetical protein BC828DRAFT_2345 [Blastocladiella britannica]